MSRFFVNPDAIENSHIVIADENVNHIKNVLRLSRGDTITVCDGNCKDYLVRIDNFDKSGIYGTILDSWTNQNEMPTHIVLYQGLAKGDKMATIIQKSVELGVFAIVPVITERTIVRIQNDRDVEKKVQRWQKIAEEAAKQSNRGIIPEISLPMMFGQALNDISQYEFGLLPYENEENASIRTYISDKSYSSIAVMIGPEGGFSAYEAKTAEEKGLKLVTLGPRILRTETAGIAVLAVLGYVLGGMD